MCYEPFIPAEQHQTPIKMNNLQVLMQYEAITVEVHKELNFLKATWHKQPTSDVFRKYILEITDYALENGITIALFDVRQRGYMEFGDQNWSMKEIFPRLQGKVKKLAYLINLKNLQHMDTIRLKESIANSPLLTKEFQIELFLEHEEALKWLQE